MPDDVKIAYFVCTKADNPEGQPAQIVGWNAIQYEQGQPTPSYDPPDGYSAYEIPGMTADRWDQLRFDQNGCGGGLAYEGGRIVPYSAPVYQPPLKQRADAALQQARTTVYNNYGILGEPTPAAWVAYLKALMAITNGTDTTSTTLPTAPADPAT